MFTVMIFVIILDRFLNVASFWHQVGYWDFKNLKTYCWVREELQQCCKISGHLVISSLVIKCSALCLFLILPCSHCGHPSATTSLLPTTSWRGRWACPTYSTLQTAWRVLSFLHRRLSWGVVKPGCLLYSLLVKTTPAARAIVGTGALPAVKVLWIITPVSFRGRRNHCWIF